MKEKKIVFNLIIHFFLTVCLINSVFGQDKKVKKTLFGKSINADRINPENGVIRCATPEYEEFLQEKDSKRMSLTQFESWLSPLLNKNAILRTSQTNAIITIPVVVHVIYNGQAVGIAPNITDTQVESQITVLNQDYRKLINTPGYNTNPVGADSQIQFVLAQQDPNGNPTNGIDRVSICQESWGTADIESTLKPATIWDPTQYMNIWTVQFTENNNLLGYAQFPDGSGLSGIGATGGNANTDGIVSSYTVFGSGSGSSFLLKAPYNKGRTMTHEVGHWLGLIHIWGDTTNCNTNTDYCADTPVAQDSNYGCPTGIDTCTNKSGLDMIENYMDYTNDACMNIFTQNQKDRMDAVLNNSIRRKSLKTSNKANAITLFSNDAEVKLESTCSQPSCSTTPNEIIQNITIYNRGTSSLTSATLNYSINGGNSIVYNWNGNLAKNKFATFSIPFNATINGTIAVSIDKVNGGIDQRTSNNTVTGNFVTPTAVSNYTPTQYVFRLQRDYFGSETTWNIKDSNGIVLYTGGPYDDTYVDENTISVTPELITEIWFLASNQCYTFTINDSEGDGICCGTGLGSSGNGFYDIKSSDGTILISSGTTFQSSQSKSFFITTLLIDTEKPSLIKVDNKEEAITINCEFVIPDYTTATTVWDNSGTYTIFQSPIAGTLISGLGTKQEIILTAADNSGNSASTTFEIMLIENEIYVYPNPTKEFLKINTPICSTNPIYYTIYTVLGQKIMQKKIVNSDDLTIDTFNLKKGVYFIIIEKESQKKTFQFLKE